MEPTEREGMIQDLVSMADERDEATVRAKAAEEDRDQWKLLYRDSLAREMRLLGRIELRERDYDAAIARADAALADAAECRAERARYGNRMTSMLASAEAYIERIRIALGGWTDSDLVSLAETLAARNDALEKAVADTAKELNELYDKTSDW